MSRDRMIYLTYGDMDSPVFETQVIGFCDFVERELDIDVQLVSFVPLRLYADQKKKLSRYNRNVKVYPVINRWQGSRWYSRLNARLIGRMGAKSIMCRNPIAAEVIVKLKESGMKYFYDARGCQYVELKEFSEASPQEIESMKVAEVKSFQLADWVFSVSNSLVEYFKENHRYREHTFSVVPCCYNVEEKVTESPDSLRKRLIGDRKGKVFCYAGSLGVWNFPQSFIDLIRKVLKDKENTLVILSKDIEKLAEHRFLHNNEQVFLKSVGVKEVKEYLSISDYAILLRKRAVTNAVASPSKFAEYLASGAQVIISPEVGDLTRFVVNHGCGAIYRNKKDGESILALPKIDGRTRDRNRLLAQEYFQRASPFNLIKYRNLKNVHEGNYNE